MQGKTLLVIVGPTGVGKTRISIRLARQWAAPIVSADSRQFYRELRIGTAAPTDGELQAARHYFIGTHSIHDEYNSGQFELDVHRLLGELFQAHDLVLLVGGSMMYVDAVCHGIDDLPTIDAATRAYWQEQYRTRGRPSSKASCSGSTPSITGRWISTTSSGCSTRWRCAPSQDGLIPPCAPGGRRDGLSKS